MKPDIDFLEKLLDVVMEELPPGGDKRVSGERVSVKYTQFYTRISPKKKLVTMFLRKTQGVHVMCPPPLLKELGYALDEERDRDGDQKVIWSFGEAEASARQLGQNLASLLIDAQPTESLESRVSKLEGRVAKIEILHKALSRWSSQEG